MRLETESGPLDVRVDHLAIAGWTGRDKAQVDHHIAELQAIGVRPPSRTPLFYRVSSSLLTTETRISVLGEGTSGEAEPVIIRHDDRLWLGLGSDHTDRELEKASIAASKQACAKPVAAQVWDYDSVAGHIDDLVLESWIGDGDAWTPYQSGRLEQILPVSELLQGADLPRHGALFCGTLPTLSGIRGAAWFRSSMIDPVANRRIDHEYAISVLPVVE